MTMTATRRWTLACVLSFAGCDKGDAPASGDAEAPVVANADADAAAAPTEKALPEAEAVLAKAVDALGGKDKLGQVKSFYYEGRIEILGQNIAGDSKIWWKNGDFYTEQDMPGIGTARAGKLGDEVWADDPI